MSQQHTPHVQRMFPKLCSFSLNSFKIWLFLIDKGSLFYSILPMTRPEFGLRRNDLAGGRNILDPFLKPHRIGFQLK